MSARISTWVKSHPVVAMYVLAFAITWLGWLPQALYSRGLFPFDSPLFYILGGVGPLAAVFIVLSILNRKDATGEIFSPFWKWKVGTGWYAWALLGYPALWMIALVLRGDLAEELAIWNPSLALLPTFLLSFVAAIPESVAWRGFALPRLQTRYSALVTSLIVGFLWGLWHLPLLLNLNSPMSAYPIGWFLISTTALQVVYTWMFNNTGGSLLILTLFHAASNTVNPFSGVAQAIVFTAAAAVLVLTFGPRCLSRGKAVVMPAASAVPNAGPD